MFITRIFRPSEIAKPKARGRRSQSQYLFQLESLENRTALSVGVNIGFVSAVISKPTQVGPADVSQSRSTDLTIQATITLYSPPLAGSTVLIEDSVRETLADGSRVVSGNVEQVAQTAVYVQSVAPPFDPRKPPVATEPGASPTWFGSNAQGQNDPPAVSSTAVADDALVVDLSGSIATGSRDDQYIGPPPGPIAAYTGPGEIVGPRFLEDAYDFGEMEFTSPPPGFGTANWPGAKLQQPLIDLNAINDPDISVLGSLMSSDLHGSGPALMMTESNAGRASGSGFGSISTGLTTQMDQSTDSGGSGWMSYVATGGLVVSGAQSTTFRGDMVPAPDETATEPSTPASITAGELPLSVLLSGPEAPAHTGSDRLEQVAELIPLDQSSLALVATLWTVSSDSQTPLPQIDVAPAGGSIDPGAPLASPPSWTVYVIGLNEAFEQSQRDVEQGFFSSPGRPIEGAGGQGALDEGLPWQGPIVPAAERGTFEKVRGGFRTGSLTSHDEATELRGRNEVRPCDSGRAEAESSQAGERQVVAVASLPTISAVSTLGLIAGWFWTQRERLARFRPGRSVRISRRSDHIRRLFD
jgi:hypothetical protein